MELVELVYAITRAMPDSERFGLVSQLQRASVSVPSNIAEGFGLGGGGYRKHVRIARGSLMEVEVQLELAVRLKLVDREAVIRAWQLAQVVGRMLTKLSAALKGL